MLVNRHRSLLRRTLVRAKHLHGAPERSVQPHGSELHIVLWAALGQLPKAQRTILVLRFYEDLSEAEVARLVRLPVNTVKSHTRRDRARLRRDRRGRRRGVELAPRGRRTAGGVAWAGYQADTQPQPTAGRPATGGPSAGRGPRDHRRHQVFRSSDGQVCQGFDPGDGASCGQGTDTTTYYGVNPYEQSGGAPIGTVIDGGISATAVRVRIELRGQEPLLLRTAGGKEFGMAYFATVLPGRVFVERITAYDTSGGVVFDDDKPYNTEWPERSTP